MTPPIATVPTTATPAARINGTDRKIGSVPAGEPDYANAFIVHDALARPRPHHQVAGLVEWEMKIPVQDLCTAIQSNGNVRSPLPGGYAPVRRSLMGENPDDTPGLFDLRHGTMRVDIWSVEPVSSSAHRVVPTTLGLLDGSSSHQAFLEATRRLGHAIPPNEQVRVIFVVRLPGRYVGEVTGGLNMNHGPRRTSRLARANYWDVLATALRRTEYADRIAWDEHQERGGRVPIEYVIRVLQVLHPGSYPNKTAMPKLTALANWQAHHARMTKLFPLAADIFKLHDLLQAELTAAWADAGHPAERPSDSIRVTHEAFGDTRWARFSAPPSDGAVARWRPISNTLLIPALGAFRCYLRPVGDRFKWVGSLPKALAAVTDNAPLMCHTLRAALLLDDGMGVAKDPSVWRTLYNLVR